ncbi:MAG: ROK family protein [Kocuria sp.]|nr:ROK family protein [Kocuria sp.]
MSWANRDSMRKDVVLSLDIGGTKTTAAVVAVGAETPVILGEATVPTPSQQGASAVLSHAFDAADRAVQAASCTWGQLAAVGIAAAGVIDPHNGTVTHATDAITGWAGTDLVAAFQQKITRPVRALNDVHAHGLGEARFGVGKAAHSLLLVAVGTGVGGCQVIAGSPVRGARGAAGHLGHIPVSEALDLPCPCGGIGHLEAVASGPAILAQAQRLGYTATDGKELAARARDGLEPALQAYRTAGLATGRVIGGLLNTMDVDLIALTGGVIGASADWRASLQAGIRQEAMDIVASTPIYDATLGVRAALFGAASYALDHI